MLQFFLPRSIIIRCSILILLAVMIEASYCFTPRTYSPSQQVSWGVLQTPQRQVQTHKTIRPNTILHAIIYEPDGTSKIDDDDFYQRYNDLRTSHSSDSLVVGNSQHQEDNISDNHHHHSEKQQQTSSPSSLAGTYSQNHKDVLTRLAVAFSPPTQNVQLQQINDIHVLDVDDHHIDIEAVICEDESCIIFRVPVDFPHPCHGDETTDHCIVYNLEDLDEQATEKLKTQEQQQPQRHQKWTTTEETELLQSWQDLKSFQHDTMDKFPSWWVPSLTLEQDCQGVKELLNNEQGDYDTEVQALATYALHTIRGNYNVLVEQAAVVAVCPAGMYIRAKVLPTTTTTRNTSENKEISLDGSGGDDERVDMSSTKEKDRLPTVEVPIPFQRGTVYDSPLLQEAVLDTIASAMEYMRKCDA